MNSPVLCLVIILIVIIVIIVIVGIANYSNTNSQCNNFKNKKMPRRRGKFTNGISCPPGYVATYSKIPVNCSTDYTANGSSYQVCSEIATSVCVPTAIMSTVTTTMPLTVITSPYYPPFTGTGTTSLYYPPATVATPPVTGGTVATGGGGGGMMRGGGGMMRGGGGRMRGGGGRMRGGGGRMRDGGKMRGGRKGGFANGATIHCPAGSTISYIKVPNCVKQLTAKGGIQTVCNTITSSVCVPIVNMNNALPAAEYNALLYLQHVK